jgi:hypothetical protein
MIAESFEPLDIECLVKTAVELWEDPHNLYGLSKKQKEVLGRASKISDDEDAGRAAHPAVTALVSRGEENTVWVLRRSDSHTDGEITLWDEEDSAYGFLAEHVRECWDNVRYDFVDVPDVPPADDREAAEYYYGAGRADDSYTIYADTIKRHTPEQSEAK